MHELIVPVSFFDLFGTPFFVKDSAGVYIYCNNAFSSYLGLSRGHIISRHEHEVAALQASANSPPLFKYFMGALMNEDATPIRNETEVFMRISGNQKVSREVVANLGAVHPPYDPNHELESDKYDQISKREWEVLRHLIKGKPFKVIANELNLSPLTVADYTKIIYQKLGVHSKGEAISKTVKLMVAHSILREG